MHLLRAPPRTGKYAALKQLLLWSHSLSAAERADKLLSLPGLGDGSAVDLMDNMLSLLCSDEGGFLFLHIFLRQLPPPVCAALANSPCLAASDFCGLAEEGDRLLLSSRCLSVQGVASDTLQAAAEDEDPVMVVGVSIRRRRGNLCFFHQPVGRGGRCFVPSCTIETTGTAKARGSGPQFSKGSSNGTFGTRSVTVSVDTLLIGIL